MFVLFFYDYIETFGNYPYYYPSSISDIPLPNIYTDDQNVPGSSIQQQLDVYRPGIE